MNKKKKIIIISAFCITVIAVVIITVCIYNHKDTSLSAIGNIYESNAAGLVETENLIYYVSDIQMGYINVYDKNTKATSVLCNNPECKHNTPSCVASVFEPRMCINTLCTYNNNLYYVDYDISAGNRVALYRVSMDGSSKDNILTVYEFPDGEEISLQDINISSNGENIYMYTGECYDGEDPLKKRLIVYKISLKDESIKKLTEDDKYGGYIDVCGFDSDNIYYSIIYFSEDLKNTYGSVYRYNIKTEEKEILVDELKSVNTLCLSGKYIYYNVFQGNVYKYDLNTGKTEEFISFENPENMAGRLYADNTYIYYYNYNADYADETETYLYVYDKNGELKGSVKALPTDENIIKAYVINDKLIFGTSGITDDTKMKYSCIDKNDITAGEIKWRDLLPEN